MCQQLRHFNVKNVRRRLPHQYAPRQAMSTVEDIALPRARRRCYNIAITRQSWPAVASRPSVARMWPDETWPGRPWLADGGRTRLRGDVTAVTSPSSVGRGDVLGRGHRLSRSILTGESSHKKRVTCGADDRRARILHAAWSAPLRVATSSLGWTHDVAFSRTLYTSGCLNKARRSVRRRKKSHANF